MTAPALPGLFVIGTDTEVGKTYVAARVAESLVRAGVRVGVYKPVASGCRLVGDGLEAGDAVRLWEAAGRPGDLQAVCPQRFEAAVSPPRAALAAGRHVDEGLLRSGLDYWIERSDFLLVEGAGGLMSPISEESFVADLAYEFGFPLLVVVPNLLGAINQTLQTLIAATTFRDGIPIGGIILNAHRADELQDASAASNREDLERYCVPPVLASLGWLARRFDREIEWTRIAAR
jgi:dethiobiotin synthetase